MAGPFDFTGQNIEDSYQRVLQTDGTLIYDGTGSLFTPPPTSLAYRHDFNVYDYVGKAASGSLDNDDVWTITRLTIAVNGSVTKGVANDVNWTDRYTHIYS